MKLREPLQTETYFADAIAEKEKRVKQLDEYVTNKANYSMNWEVIYMNHFFDCHILAELYYSAGYNMDIINKTAAICLQNGIEYYTSAEYIKNYKINRFKTDFNEYYNIISVLSMALLLKIDTGLVNKFCETIKIKGDDALVDRLHQFINPVVLCSKKLVFEKAMQPAYNIFDIPAAEKAEHLLAYLTNWDKTVLRKRSVFNTHKPGYGTAFYGYWSFESAAIAYINNIKEEKLTSCKYFPADLFMYAQKN